MLKKIGLLSLLVHLSLFAMQPLTDLSKQFRDAYAADKFDQAQQAINQIKPIRPDLAENFQKLLNDKKDLMQRQKPKEEASNVAQQKIIADKDAQIAQLQKELALAKQNVVSSQANAELRTRLADAEKACQAQTKKAEDSEKQCKDSNVKLKGTEEALRKQIEEMKKVQGTAAEQAQRSEIIRKKQDELYAANQKYEKQVRELTAQLETSQKDAKDLQKAVDDKADDIFVLETERDAARKEIESIAKEVRTLGTELKEQKEAYAALQYTGSGYNKQLKAEQEKCAVEIKDLTSKVQTGKEVVAKTEELKKKAIATLKNAMSDYIGELRSIGSNASPEVRNAIRKIDDKMTAMIQQPF